MYFLFFFFRDMRMGKLVIRQEIPSVSLLPDKRDFECRSGVDKRAQSTSVCDAILDNIYELASSLNSEEVVF
jgi:hypothetical protein